jgi:hypothetical protein
MPRFANARSNVPSLLPTSITSDPAAADVPEPLAVIEMLDEAE